MLKCAAVVDRLVKPGADASTIALGEALPCPETLKCVDPCLEAGELDWAKGVLARMRLAARLDAVTCGTGLPVALTATAQRVGRKPSELMGSSTRGPTQAPRPGIAAPAAGVIVPPTQWTFRRAEG
jgi:hypothetical protein